MQINIYEDESVSYWCERFGIPKQALKHVVGKVGPDVFKVANFLITADPASLHP
jgi:hypothetical protein